MKIPAYVLALVFGSGLAGCATVNPGPAFADIQQNARKSVSQPVEWSWDSEPARWIAGEIQETLAGDLSVEGAVRVALLNNPSLQATFEEVGISQAEVAEAAAAENPEFSGSLRSAKHVSGRSVELSLIQNVFDLLLRPARKRLAAVQLERTKAQVSHAILSLAADVKEAFYTLQAQQQLAARLEQIADLTAVAADFARKQYEAGVISELDLENHTALHGQSRVEAARARAAISDDREALNRLLGLWGPQTAWRVTAGLDELPATEIALEGLESLAVAQRQDISAARFGVDLVGRALALKTKTRFFPVGINIGVVTEKEIGGDRLTGPEWSLQLPLFDTGRASVARLRHEHRRAQRELEALSVHARSEVREAHNGIAAARDVAEYYRQVLLPQRVRILDLTLRRYNMMFKGAYDLLLAKQNEVEAEQAYIESWRDYWIHRARLERALGGALPTDAGAPGAAERP